ncbi:hypothetical protein [Pseudomonas oryzihabitans]|uniref:hypothetical protein n=1 Tax=Pseudomonas oryzihabitans TaxID=47885 RepID=UPI00165E3524|nr:hypothetical protein [Pseudomonas psychrotolerans]
MERTLFVFEGERLERLYFGSLEKVFFPNQEERLLATFKNDIYELYKEISADDDLDLFELVKELNPSVNEDDNLTRLRRDQIGQIYLFFDFEPSDDQFGGRKLLEMLNRFDNETEHGKLFISYPMVEAIRDIDNVEEFLARSVAIEDSRGKIYKRMSAERGSQAYQDARKITALEWRFLIEANLRKANLIIESGNPLGPVNNQACIARKQLNEEDENLPRDPLFVLSAFPIFLADYFGLDILRDSIT